MVSTVNCCDIVLTIFLLQVSWGSAQGSLSMVINDILIEQAKVSEIALIVDWSSPSQHELLSDISMPATKFEAQKIVDSVRHTKQICPIIIPYKNMKTEEQAHIIKDNEIFRRQDLIISADKLPLTMVV